MARGHNEGKKDTSAHFEILLCYFQMFNSFLLCMAMMLLLMMDTAISAPQLGVLDIKLDETFLGNFGFQYRPDLSFIG